MLYCDYQRLLSVPSIERRDCAPNFLREKSRDSGQWIENALQIVPSSIWDSSLAIQHVSISSFCTHTVVLDLNVDFLTFWLVCWPCRTQLIEK